MIALSSTSLKNDPDADTGTMASYAGKGMTYRPYLPHHLRLGMETAPSSAARKRNLFTAIF